MLVFEDVPTKPAPGDPRAVRLWLGGADRRGGNRRRRGGLLDRSGAHDADDLAEFFQRLGISLRLGQRDRAWGHDVGLIFGDGHLAEHHADDVFDG